MKPQIVKLVIGLASVALVMPGDVPLFKPKTLASVSPQLLLTDLDRIATNITVEILGMESLGSGIILNRQGDTYTVVTNQHVLRAARSPYRIKTSDGLIHPAIVIQTVISTKYDLALLKFSQPDKNYQAATIGSSSSLAVGESIFAAGFPSQKQENNFSKSDRALGDARRNKNKQKPVLKTGRVTVILDQPLEEGYQIGYTNDVQKGMSGGPLLNSRGEVIGINGKHAYPLWDAPDFYEDGSQPCPPLQELITSSSLAIPIEKIVQLRPKLFLSSPSTNDNISTITLDSDKESGTAELIKKMQVEAEARKNCREVPNESQLIRP